MTEATYAPEQLEQVAHETNVPIHIVKKMIELLEDGNTVPFIARYRKEMTGGADEVQLRQVSERWEYVRQLEARKQEVIRLIDEQEKLTEELQGSINAAAKLQEVEDLYRPYKQKRRTRATKAKEKGLEPLAEWIWAQAGADIQAEAMRYIDEDKEVPTAEAALEGAQDIMAEWMADDASVRKQLRAFTMKQGSLRSTGKKAEEDEQDVYAMYYDYEEPVRRVPSHRVLAMNRGEKEGILAVQIALDEERALEDINKALRFQEKQPACAEAIRAAVKDGYKRLLGPSIERDIRKELTETAEEQAIHVFSENLRNLLLQPPLKGKMVLGVDPAYRTGCKLAVVNTTGKVQHVETIYPTPPKNQVEESKKVVTNLVEKYGIELIAIGNGTASRETESFIADTISSLQDDVSYLIINEAGASVYSASELARREFPDLQTEERSAASIARRLQDPLAELVKIDPQSIGVGQYQHDVSANRLKDSLTFVVETAVNQVGVNLNTASSSLLQYVAGLSRTVADNIVVKRDEDGKFESRAQLKKIPRLGAKTYEQAVGFLRIPESKEPLDETAIHPESYNIAKALLKQVELTPGEIGSEEAQEKLNQLNVKAEAERLDVGQPTLEDIISALKQPNRDVRDDLPKPMLKTGVMNLEDLYEGMELQGTVRNVVDFGAFIDIGVKQDGLVHISKLANNYVRHPMEVVAVGDIVTVWVESVDEKKGRIALTMV
ncbi:Tex family protein [Salsuginibacillus kocurii]|uniref:Tex family protein n=1 Tax=Salsuginibacillus kocurii TaxID=427078 RepID=UPI0003714573|nr:Tex family protein [Salsuginibacillus kocurii]